MPPNQLTLDLGHRTALAREDFLVAPSNAAAVALVDQWPQWPSHAAILVGPAGSGKSHLASVWQQKARASLSPARQIEVGNVPEVLASGTAVLEDLAAGGFDESALFHALNLARQNAGHMLLTSTTTQREWNLKLPDLASRLSALPEVHILLPDDALLRGVLVKHFNDHQIAVGEAVVSYLLTRMPRSLAFAREIVAEIDAEALAARAEVTRPFVAKVLDRRLSPQIFHHDGD